jgi:mycoredoxin-dependent peroxiredoxin
MRKLVLGVTGTMVLVAATTIAAAGQGGQAPAGQAPPPPPPPAIKVGEAVPDFTLPYMSPKAGGGYENKEMKLSEFKGKQNVVLAFFPAAFSPGCTSEMQKYRDSSGQFTSVNTQIFGVSVDSTWANKAFREQIGAEFPILSDWKKEVSRKLGVLDENSGFARRTTFVIDKQGIVQKIDQGRDALDPSGVVGVCEKLHKGTGNE